MDADSSLSDSSGLSSPSSTISDLCFGYPSPESSQSPADPNTSLSASEAPAKRKHGGDDESAPKKKRKRPEPKPRSTDYLDLTDVDHCLALDQPAALDKLMKVLRKRRKIVVIAGAGISVAAGIPDFRSSTGLFKSLKGEHKLKASGKQLFDASVYQTDSSTSSFHDMVRSLSGLVKDAQPTAFHEMLSELGREGRLLRLYTQNIDGIDVGLPHLETSVPLNPKGPWPRTVQLHGGLETMSCSKCQALSAFQPELFNGPEPPLCEKCVLADNIRTDHAKKRSHGVGRLRPRIVLYNEHNPDEEAIGAVVSADLRARPDALIVVGTTLKIPGVRRIVKEMCGVVRHRRDGLTVWLNHDAPPTGVYFDDCWDLIARGPCDEAARQLNSSHDDHSACISTNRALSLRKGHHEECSTSDVERARARGGVSVCIESPHKSREPIILTPAASPLPQPAKIHITLKVKDEAGSKKAQVKQNTVPKATKGTSNGLIPPKHKQTKFKAASGPSEKPMKKQKKTSVKTQGASKNGKSLAAIGSGRGSNVLGSSKLTNVFKASKPHLDRPSTTKGTSAKGKDAVTLSGTVSSRLSPSGKALDKSRSKGSRDLVQGSSFRAPLHPPTQWPSSPVRPPVEPLSSPPRPIAEPLSPSRSVAVSPRFPNLISPKRAKDLAKKKTSSSMGSVPISAMISTPQDLQRASLPRSQAANPAASTTIPSSTSTLTSLGSSPALIPTPSSTSRDSFYDVRSHTPSRVVPGVSLSGLQPSYILSVHTPVPGTHMPMPALSSTEKDPSITSSFEPSSMADAALFSALSPPVVKDRASPPGVPNGMERILC